MKLRICESTDNKGVYYESHLYRCSLHEVNTLWPSADILKPRVFQEFISSHPQVGGPTQLGMSDTDNPNHWPAHVNRQRLYNQLRIGSVNEYSHMYNNLSNDPGSNS
jgi:hypothetical protein